MALLSLTKRITCSYLLVLAALLVDLLVFKRAFCLAFTHGPGLVGKQDLAVH
jgi:hypothetical protein